MCIRDRPQIDVYDAALLQQLEALPDGVIAASERIAPLQPDHLAYLIYTSGSTGVPKGTALAHQNLLHYLLWARKTYPCDYGIGAPINTSIAFDATITSLWLPLISGSRVSLFSGVDDIEELAKQLNQQSGFSLVKLTPIHMDVLCNTLETESLSEQTRSYIVGGEQLNAKTIQLWRDHAPATRIINEYGPTETVVGCCVYEVNDTTPTAVSYTHLRAHET